jgi:hypothetical protein
MPDTFYDRTASVVKHAVRPLGFSTSGRTWLRNTGGTVAVISLQRSSWSELCYLNYGIIADVLGRPQKIRVEYCHLWVRAPHPDPRDSLVEAALNPERTDVADAERGPIIEAYLRSKVDLLLRRWECFGLIKQDLDRGALKGAAMTAKLNDFLQGREFS